MKQHKHAELIKAWADGAEIQCPDSDGEWDMASSPAWDCDKKYRINPVCEYAIEKIRELGGVEAVEFYRYWLGGGTLQGEIFKCTTVEDFLPPSCDPFQGFQGIISYQNVRKKKQTVKQVLWVSDSNAPSIPQSGNKLHADWFEDGFNPNNKPELTFRWHKVPTCTREVEV